YDSGTLGDIWPLGHVTLSLHGPFLTNVTLAAAVLADISYPETQITLEDLHLVGNQSVWPFRESAKRRIRFHYYVLFCFFCRNTRTSSIYFLALFTNFLCCCSSGIFLFATFLCLISRLSTSWW
ncbi:hypothetical protein XENOCAPTIV_016105, partial [Xenoophorus captivus]